MPVIRRIREFLYRFSTLIAFVIAAAILLAVAPATDQLRGLGLKDDLIRFVLLATAIIPSMLGGLLIRLLVAPPDQASQSETP